MEQTVFRNVGIYNSDAGELPRRKHTTFSEHLSVCVLTLEDRVERDRPRMTDSIIRSRNDAICMPNPKATHIHSQYILLMALPR
jgi:hypothetical protein